MKQNPASYTPEDFHNDVAGACGMSTGTPRPLYSVQVPCPCCEGGRVELANGDDVMCLRCAGKGLVEGGL